jgi:hypothetical protein
MLCAMRVIYSTPRLDNAQRVADLLATSGVATRLLYGPHFRRKSWRATDYRKLGNPGDWPRVLVLANEDLPKARSLLRQAGLLAPAAFEHPGQGAAVTVPALSAASPGTGSSRLPGRLRIALLTVLMAVMVIQTLRWYLAA